MFERRTEISHYRAALFYESIELPRLSFELYYHTLLRSIAVNIGDCCGSLLAFWLFKMMCGIVLDRIFWAGTGTHVSKRRSQFSNRVGSAHLHLPLPVIQLANLQSEDNQNHQFWTFYQYLLSILETFITLEWRMEQTSLRPSIFNQNVSCSYLIRLIFIWLHHLRLIH